MTATSNNSNNTMSTKRRINFWTLSLQVHRSNTITMASSSSSSIITTISKVMGRPTWQQTMLRISNPKKSIPFYTDIMGMTVIDTLDFPQWKFKLFFLTTIPEGESYTIVPGTKEAHVRFYVYTFLLLYFICLCLDSLDFIQCIFLNTHYLLIDLYCLIG